MKTRLPLFFTSFLVLTACLILNGCGEAWKPKARISMSPAHKARAAELSRKPMRIAVLPFTYEADPAIGETVTEQFTAELVSVPVYSTVERQRINEVLQEHKFGASALIDEKTAVKIGKLLGAQGVILGRVTKYEAEPGWTGLEYFGMSARLVDTQSGVVLWAGNHNLDSGPLDVPDELDALVIFTIREIIDELNKALGYGR